jgi:hypothetical protein
MNFTHISRSFALLLTLASTVILGLSHPSEHKIVFFVLSEPSACFEMGPLLLLLLGRGFATSH